MLSCFSCVLFFATLWTVAHQAPLSMGFPRQEYCCGLPCSADKNSPSNAGDSGSLPGYGTESPHAAGQISPQQQLEEGHVLQWRLSVAKGNE